MEAKTVLSKNETDQIKCFLMKLVRIFYVKDNLFGFFLLRTFL